MTGFSILKDTMSVVIQLFKALGISDHYPVEVELKTKDASGEGQSKKKGYFFISDSYCIYI